MCEHVGLDRPRFLYSNKSATHSDPHCPLQPTRWRRLGPRLFQSGTQERAVVTSVWHRVRAWPRRLACWCVGLGLCWPGLVGASACDAASELVLQSVLPGVAVVHGHWPSVHAQGRAHTATTVVLGQGDALTVIDPGPTYRVGRALQHTLTCRYPGFTQLAALLNTHAHAEQVLANAAWVDAALGQAVPVAATQGTQNAMRQRCPDCLAALHQDLGAEALHGTRIVLPTQVVQAGQWLQAGGRSWQVHEMRHAHTESDLVLWSPDEGIVLAGGLVDGEGLPVLAQGSVQGWLQALARMRAWQPQWLVGQHVVRGPGQVQAALQRQQQYLCRLVDVAWQGLERGGSETELAQDLDAPAAWLSGVDRHALAGHTASALQQQHAFNQLRAWREVELTWLDQSVQASPWPPLCASVPHVVR